MDKDDKKKNEQGTDEVNINETVKGMMDSIERSTEASDMNHEEQTEEQVKSFPTGCLPAIVGWIVSGALILIGFAFPSAISGDFEHFTVSNTISLLGLIYAPGLIVWIPLAAIAYKIGQKRGQKAAILFVISGAVIYLISLGTCLR